MRQYCPRSPFGYDFNSILRHVVNVEAEILTKDRPTPKAPMFDRGTMKMTPAAAYAFARGIVVGGISKITP